MNKLSFLPSSRSWNTESDDHAGCIATDDGCIVAYIAGSKRGMTGAAQDHIGALVAAPDLLKAAKDVLRHIKGPIRAELGNALTDLREAIEAAERK